MAGNKIKLNYASIRASKKRTALNGEKKQVRNPIYYNAISEPMQFYFRAKFFFRNFCAFENRKISNLYDCAEGKNGPRWNRQKHLETRLILLSRFFFKAIQNCFRIFKSAKSIFRALPEQKNAPLMTKFSAALQVIFWKNQMPLLGIFWMSFFYK